MGYILYHGHWGTRPTRFDHESHELGTAAQTCGETTNRWYPLRPSRRRGRSCVRSRGRACRHPDTASCTPKTTTGTSTTPG